MKPYLITLIARILLTVLVGCTATESTTTTEPGKPTASAELAKCETCGKEYPKAELHNHGGKLMCASAIVASERMVAPLLGEHPNANRPN